MKCVKLKICETKKRLPSYYIMLLIALVTQTTLYDSNKTSDTTNREQGDRMNIQYIY